MAMSYSDFTLAKVQDQFGLEFDGSQDLFLGVNPAPVGEGLAWALTKYGPLGLTANTEKARSEWLIAPVMAELWSRLRNQISVFSGHSFDVDASLGLTGVCDFVVCRSPQQYFITVPVLMIVEAKKEDIIGGLGQCVATMVAAQRFNRDRKHPVDVIYGCVSAGDSWKFLRLEGKTVAIDLKEYSITQPGMIMGALLQIVNPIPEGSAAA
jgi:hypothetical protein